MIAFRWMDDGLGVDRLDGLPWGLKDVPYKNATIFSKITYDSIRELSEINDPQNADAFPWISSDGLRLYYTWSTTADYLMFTERANTNSLFVSPTLIPINIPTASSYWFSTDELDVYMSHTFNLYYAHRDSISLPFNTPVNISLLGTTPSYITGASLT